MAQAKKKATKKTAAKPKTTKKAAPKKAAPKTTTKKVATKKAAPKATTKKVATKKAAPKATTKKVAPKKKAAKSTAKRKPNPAFMKPLTPSSALSLIVGNKPLPRTQVVKKIWDYIKKNGLQDNSNKQNINADDKLYNVFGKKVVSMFEMNKIVSSHLK